MRTCDAWCFWGTFKGIFVNSLNSILKWNAEWHKVHCKTENGTDSPETRATSKVLSLCGCILPEHIFDHLFPIELRKKESRDRSSRIMQMDLIRFSFALRREICENSHRHRHTHSHSSSSVDCETMWTRYPFSWSDLSKHVSLHRFAFWNPPTQ